MARERLQPTSEPRTLFGAAVRRFAAAAPAALVFVTTLALPTPGARAQGLALELDPALAVQGLIEPLEIVEPNDGTGRLFVAERGGLIRIQDGAVLRPTPFLDLSALVSCCGGRGLLGLAFHPDYATNGRFFVHYTDLAGDQVLAEYSVSATNPHLADPASATIYYTLTETSIQHNGARIAFGPDGYLYLALGDGGPGQDPDNNGQNLDRLFGKILRIDVDNPDPGRPWGIPADNPFAQDLPAGCSDSCLGAPCGATCDEIWVYGLRNPWRFSFDRQEGDLFLGDVGQGTTEEVDFQPAASPGGENYGWRLMEGSACFNPKTGCNDGSLTLPIFEYDHSAGDCSVTGGFRYRGAAQPQLDGVYLYGDFCTGTIWGTVPRCDAVWESQPLLASGIGLVSFGEDQAGELFALSFHTGEIFRLRVPAGAGGPLLEPDPTALDFGNRAPAEAVTLELELANANFGPEALLVRDLTLSDEVNFSLDPSGGVDPCGAESFCLPPGDSCTVTVTFQAPEVGFHSASLQVAANSPVGSVALDGVAFTACPYVPDLPVFTRTLDADEDFFACKTIDVGPAVIVEPGIRALFTAGEGIAIGELEVGAGAEVVLGIDPLLAVE